MNQTRSHRSNPRGGTEEEEVGKWKKGYNSSWAAGGFLLSQILLPLTGRPRAALRHLLSGRSPPPELPLVTLSRQPEVCVCALPAVGSKQEEKLWALSKHGAAITPGSEVDQTHAVIGDPPCSLAQRPSCARAVSQSPRTRLGGWRDSSVHLLPPPVYSTGGWQTFTVSEAGITIETKGQNVIIQQWCAWKLRQPSRESWFSKTRKQLLTVSY